jgi:hypothetical protein
MAESLLTEGQREELVGAIRATCGDELRSITYFTPDAVEQVYLRGDLEQTADLVGFAENERLGFQSQMVYTGTDLGDYQFTIRVFARGYLTRVIAGDQGIWVTTDEMEIGRFEELGSAMVGILRDFDRT